MSDPVGFFKARILKDGRITVEKDVREIYELAEGDLCLWRFVRIIKQEKSIRKEADIDDE